MILTVAIRFNIRLNAGWIMYDYDCQIQIEALLL